MSHPNRTSPSGAHTRRRRAAFPGLASALLWSVVAPVGAGAATLVVDSAVDPGDGSCTTNGCTLREAVGEAVSGDTIVFDATLGQSAPATIVLWGDEIDVKTSVTIEGNPMLAIDGDGASGIFAVFGTTTDATIRDLTLRNGSASSGGAITTSARSLLVEDVTFEDNRATIQGGAIHVQELTAGIGSLTVRRSVFLANRVEDTLDYREGGGGAIAANADLTVEGCRFEGNVARQGGRGNSKEGGAIYFEHPDSPLLIDQLTPAVGDPVPTVFLSNEVDSSGGALSIRAASAATVRSARFESNASDFFAGAAMIAARETAVDIVDTHFTGNTAGLGSGGALSLHGQAVLVRTVLRDNSAERDGGAIFNQSAGSVIEQSELSGNTAIEQGGAIANWVGGQMQIRNATLSGNTAFQGGAIASAQGNTTDSRVELLNVTLAGNIATDPDGGGSALWADARDCSPEPPAFFELANTILDDDGPSITPESCASTCASPLVVSAGGNFDDGWSCGLDGLSDHQGVDALLGPLADNGGTGGQTHLLQPGSSAIDGAGAACPPIDQRQRVRPSDGDGDGFPACDSGAVEVDAPTNPTPDQLLVRCTHAPIWPQPGDGVTVEARAVDGENTPVPVDTLEIWLTPVGADDLSPDPPSSPAGSDADTASFTFEATDLKEDFFAYGCRATLGETTVFTGWRLTPLGDAAGTDEPIPVIQVAPLERALDFVFIPDEDDYDGPLDPLFLEAVADVIRDAYFASPLYLAHQRQMNFWIARDSGDAQPFEGGLCSHDLPESYKKNYGVFADVGILLHAEDEDFRDCAPPFRKVFSSSAAEPATVRHESGHQPFGLADEYCGQRDGADPESRCDGGYFQNPPFPNVYWSPDFCAADAPDLGRAPEDCQEFFPDRIWYTAKLHLTEDGFAVSDPPDDDLMVDNTRPREADIRRIEWMFAKCEEGKC